MAIGALLIVCFAFISLIATEGDDTLSSNDTTGYVSTRLIPFMLTKRYVKHALISAGERNIHTTVLSDRNLIDLLRIRVRLNMKCKGYNLIQVLCDHPSDSTAFFLPTEQGSCEAVGMLGGVMQEDLIANGIRPVNLSITVTSRNEVQLNYTLLIHFLDRSQYNIELPPKRVSKVDVRSDVKNVGPYHCSAIEPFAFKVTVNRSAISSLSVTLNSDDNICAVVSIHHNVHHLIQSASSAMVSTSHITFNRFATLRVPLEKLPTSFSLLVFVFSDDTICDPNAQPREFAKKKAFRVSFSMEPLPSRIIPMISALAFYTSIPFVFFGMVRWIYPSHKRNSSELEMVRMETIVAHSPPLLLDLATERDIETNVLEDTPQSADNTVATLKPDEEVDLASLEERIKNESNSQENRCTTIQEYGVEPSTVKDFAFVHKTSDSALSYFIIGPVGVQLLLTIYAERMRSASDEDICYHNYECSYPWGPFRSFNHIVSNFGYFVLGATYCTFVYLWKRTHEGSLSHGLQPSFAILYGIGSALGIEAFASSIYHICPNSIAFHFDTPYIELLCSLVIAHLYSARHDAISSRSSIALACAILFYHTLWGFSSLQPTLSVVQLFIVFVVESKIFFGSHLKFDVWHPHENIKAVCKAWHTFLGSRAKAALLIKRLILMSVVFVANIGLLLTVFFVASSPSSHNVLYFTASNMILYFIYYFVNKMMCAESVPVFALLCWSIATVFWVIACYFFSRSETDWTATVAQSRALNRACSLLAFYDAHDLWHFSSSLAAFFSLIAVTVIDDDLSDTPRSEIDIF